MLVIQNQVFIWGKAERGGPCAELRSQFPRARRLAGMPEPPSGCEVLEHTACFHQEGLLMLDTDAYIAYTWEQSRKKRLFPPEQIKREIAERQQSAKRSLYHCYPGLDALRLPHIRIIKGQEGYQVVFHYSNGGAPYRRGHNEAYCDESSRFYGMDVLNETAFVLGPGQYGRLQYNERETAWETGGWYYRLYCINLAYARGAEIGEDLFLREPDYCYHQLARLY